MRYKHTLTFPFSVVTDHAADDISKAEMLAAFRQRVAEIEANPDLLFEGVAYDRSEAAGADDKPAPQGVSLKYTRVLQDWRIEEGQQAPESDRTRYALEVSAAPNGYGVEFDIKPLDAGAIFPDDFSPNALFEINKGVPCLHVGVGTDNLAHIFFTPKGVTVCRDSEPPAQVRDDFYLRDGFASDTAILFEESRSDFAPERLWIALDDPIAVTPDQVANFTSRGMIHQHASLDHVYLPTCLAAKDELSKLLEGGVE